MKIISKDKRLRDFDFWSGAKDTVDYLTSDDLDTIEDMLEDAYPDGMTETQLNDLFWFDTDVIAEWLGYDDFESLINERSV
jgi:hypothetical protein